MQLFSLIIISFVFFPGFGQSNSVSITYEVNMLDPETGEVSFLGQSIEHSFEIRYDSKVVFVYNQFNKNYLEQRFINKTDNEVMYMVSNKNDSSVFFMDIETMEQMDMSSHFSDTVITITNDYKEILGFNCNKIIYNFGDQATTELWVTKSLSSGVILPGSPLSTEYIALECKIQEPGVITVYKAKTVETISDTIIFPEIPEGYKLLVPVSKFDVSGVFEDEESDFAFVRYPSYPKGKKILHDEILSRCPRNLKTQSLLSEMSFANITFTITSDGTLSDIKISGIDKIASEKVTEYLNTLIFEPGSVKGEKVSSFVTLIVNLNKD